MWTLKCVGIGNFLLAASTVYAVAYAGEITTEEIDAWLHRERTPEEQQQIKEIHDSFVQSQELDRLVDEGIQEEIKRLKEDRARMKADPSYAYKRARAETESTAPTVNVYIFPDSR